MYKNWRAILTEFIGTFILVFMGTGAVVVNQIQENSITHLGISFVFGAVVAALIYSKGHLSSMHINPAVTLAFWVGGLFPRHKVVGYIIAQCVGAIAGSTVLRLCFGLVGNLGATTPLDGNWWQSLVLEIILTCVLMLVILGSACDPRANSGFAGIAIGLTVGLEAACMGPITGASMNPARSLGPALVAGVWQHHWVYWIAPIVGALLAVFLYRLMSDDRKFPLGS